jgi:hypothetical protein
VVWASLLGDYTLFVMVLVRTRRPTKRAKMALISSILISGSRVALWKHLQAVGARSNTDENESLMRRVAYEKSCLREKLLVRRVADG